MNHARGNYEWQHAEPEQLRDLIKDHLSGEDGKQFRRVIRYLKRWRSEKFPSAGNASPVGIGISVAAHKWFVPQRSHGAYTEAHYDDLTAVRRLVDRMRADFNYAQRLVVLLPVQPRLDVFRNMTDQQMREFKQRLNTLASLLDEAQRTQDVDYLTEAFGPDMG